MTEQKKTRTKSIALSLEQDVEISFIDIDESGNLLLADKDRKPIPIKAMHIGDSYLRNKKAPKVLRQASYFSNPAPFDTKIMGKNFDALIVADTNYKKINGYNVCAGAVGIVLWKNPLIRRFAQIHIQSTLLFISPLEMGNPEYYNWCDAIQRFCKSGLHEEDSKYALVGDSDILEIPKITSKDTPLWENYYLPENFEMIYAGDKGKDHFLNKAMSLCDKESARVLSSFIENNLDENRLDNLNSETIQRIAYVEFKGRSKGPK